MRRRRPRRGDGSYAQPYSDALSQQSLNTAPPQPDLYVVRKGDTLSGIAGGDYAKVTAIATANDLKLPASKGQWSGTPGDSDWISDNPAVNAVTDDQPIPFRRGHPDFSQWARGSYKFDDMTGDDSDFGKVYDAVAKEQGLPNRSAGQKWLSTQELTPHHVHDGATIELVPRALHDNVPHLGGASGLRNGGWNDD